VLAELELPSVSGVVCSAMGEGVDSGESMKSVGSDERSIVTGVVLDMLDVGSKASSCRRSSVLKGCLWKRVLRKADPGSQMENYFVVSTWCVSCVCKGVVKTVDS